MIFESSFVNRRRVSIRSKEKSTERVEQETEKEEHAEKSKKKYESRTHILENKMQE
jgi:hypothetical protein